MSDALIFHITGWYVIDEDIPDRTNVGRNNKRYIAYLFGKRYPDYKNVCVCVKGFTPYFYIQQPPDMDSTDFRENMITIVNNAIDYNVRSGKFGFDRSCENSLISGKTQVVSMKNFMGFRNNTKMKLLRLVFSNAKVMMWMARHLSKDYNRENIIKRQREDWITNKYNMSGLFAKCKVFDEVKLDNTLKLAHVRGINPCGWIKVTNHTPLTSSRTKSEFEYVCTYRDLEPVNDGFDTTIIPAIIRASYDIECNSIDGRFPQFKRPGDECAQIGCTFRRFGESESFAKFIVTLKNCSKLETNGAIAIECKDERELLIKWAQLIERFDPDIVYGYNTFGFDDEYITERSRLKKNNCEREVMRALSRHRRWSASYIKRELTSSGLGQNFLKYLDIVGRVNIDVMKEIQKNQAYKLSSYRLDDVAHEFLGERKHNVDPKEIFALLTRGDPEDIRKIADYCIQDCELVHNLVDHLGIVPGNIGMARVCHVPMDYIILRGQGIKILSLLAFEMMQAPVDERYIIEYKTAASGKTFGGAIVLHPKTGIYNKLPVVVIDFNSLYPSIMIAHNISHDTALVDERYEKIVGSDKFEEFHYNEKIENAGKVEFIKNNVKFLKYDEGRRNMGFIPRVLEELLASRTRVRRQMARVSDCVHLGTKLIEFSANEEPKIVKWLNDLPTKSESPIKRVGIRYTLSNEPVYALSIEYAKDAKINPEDNKYKSAGKLSKYDNVSIVLDSDEPIVIDTEGKTIKDLKLKLRVLDSLQQSYKVTCNSVYGQCGASTSSLYMRNVAAIVTALGQKYIKLSKKIAEDRYDAKVVYGDSVSGDSPIIVKYPNGTIDIKRIDDLVEDNEWEAYDEFKAGDSNRKDKQQSTTQLQVWTHEGFSPIRRVIRHRVGKKMYRVNTYSGCVDVTEDHSLIHLNGEKIKPGDCDVGTELYHTFPGQFPGIDIQFRYIDAWVWGFFFACGDCGDNTLIFRHTNLDKLKDAQKCLKQLGIKHFGIVENASVMYTNHPHILTAYDVDNHKYSEMFYNKHNNKQVPKEILISNISTRRAFLEGCYNALGIHKISDFNSKKRINIAIKGKLAAQGVYYLFKSIGYNKIGVDCVCDDIYSISSYDTLFRDKDRNKINSITQIKSSVETEFVYDLETTSGKFHVGVGEILVKNTDSIFIEFPVEIENSDSYTHDELRIKKLIRARELGYALSADITKAIGRPPMRIAYEKCIYPLILMKKKDYTGLWHEEDIYKSKFKMMGCAPKKRNYAQIVRKLWMGVINRIIYGKNLEDSLIGAVRYFYNRCTRLSEFPNKYFVITKSLKAGYKNPLQIAHKVLADTITRRDPGNAPQPNDRLPYIHIIVNPNNFNNSQLTTPARRRRERNPSIVITRDDILKGFQIEDPIYISENQLPIDYVEYIESQIANPIINIFRLKLPIPLLEYLFYSLLRSYGKSECVRIAIKEKKKVNPDGSTEITTSGSMRTLRAFRGYAYEIPRKYTEYVELILDYANDLKSGVLKFVT